MKLTLQVPIARTLLIAVLVGGLFPRGAFPQQSKPDQPLSVAEAQAILAEKGTELTDADLQRICMAQELTELDLSGCNQITSKGVSCVADLRELTSLSIARCHRVTIDGIRAISDLPMLARLDISQTRIPLPAVYSELTKLPSLTRLEFRDIRGFKSDGLQSLPNLKHLDISNSTGGIKDADLAPLARLTSLTYLNLNGSRQWSANKVLTDKGLKHIEGLTSLEFLGLFGHFNLTAKGYNPLFKKLGKLKTLEMGFNWPLKGGEIQLPTMLEEIDMMESFQLTDAAIVNLDLKVKQRLRTLNLFYCLELTDKSLEALRDLPDLQSLNIGCIAALTDDGLENLHGNTGLKYLNLCDNDNFTDRGLSHLKQMHSLRELHLWSTPNLKGEGLAVLSEMPQLNSLNLADCANLTDIALQYVGSSAALEELYLDNCTKLTDAGVAQLSGLMNLRELTLNGCLQLTDESLSTFEHLKSLEYLVIENCPGLTQRRITALERAFPQCHIVRD
jgi:F-box and leucine-rich repeat protein 14